MRTVGLIEVTGVDLAALVRAAYAPSRQQGLGHLDPNGTSSGLSDDVVEQVLARGRNDHLNAFSIDYLNGRSVKFHVRRAGDRLFIYNKWYDHSDGQLGALLEQVGLSADLIQKARDEETAHNRKVRDAAIEYLKERGGTVRENRGLKSLPSPEDELPDDVSDGLRIARHEGLVTEEYRHDGYTYWQLKERQGV